MVRIRPGLLAVAWVSVAACQNNTIELDDAGEGTSTSMAPGTDGDETGHPTVTTATTGPIPTPMVTSATADSGWVPGLEDAWWHLALDTGEPGLPFQFVVWAEQVQPGIWNLTFQCLALDVGSTTSPRYPVGEPTTYTGLELGHGLPFQFSTGPLVIPGEANPINGTEVTIDAFFDGNDAGDPYCGSVSGSVVAPVQADLAGSTFATTRIPGPESLPETFPAACP